MSQPAEEDAEGVMYCPNCGGEYRAGFTRCVDCELDLVPEPPRHSWNPPLSSSEPADPAALATLFVTGDLALFARAKSLLDGAGIPYLAHGEEQNEILAAGPLEPDARAEPMEIELRAEQWRTAGALLAQAGLAPVEVTPDEQGAAVGWEDDDEKAVEAPSPIPLQWAFSVDSLRGWELALVLLVAFSSGLIRSTAAWWVGSVGSVPPTVSGSLYGIQNQLISLGLLAYVLRRRERTFRDLGLDFRWADLPAGILLAVAGSLAQTVARRTMDWVSLAITGHRVTYPHHAEAAAGLTLIVFVVFSAVVNPIFEELIARAFTMTEVEALTGSTAWAILASVALQTSYHFYQGTANALAAGAMFLVSACFYARFRRITPVILAHGFWNLYVTLARL